MLGKFLIVILFAILTENVGSQDLPCHYQQSVNISGGILHANGSIFHDHYEYTKENYAHVGGPDYSHRKVEEHLRGCICKLNLVKPCLPFCCPPNEIRRGDHFADCEKSGYMVMLNTSYTKKEKINVSEKYTMVHRPPCEAHLLEEDETLLKSWKLLEVSIN